MGNGPLVGHFPQEATKEPCDITLSPAVMSEATTMDLSRQMARDGVGEGQSRNTCLLGEGQAGDGSGGSDGRQHLDNTDN